MPASDIEKLIEAYPAGESTSALARRFGIHRTTVSAHLRRAGIETRVRGNFTTTGDAAWD